jgi:hypothetical protein
MQRQPYFYRAQRFGKNLLLLNHFLKWPFKVDAAYITDSEGTTTEPFSIVIYTSSQTETQSDPVHVKADAVACVFYLANTLTPEELRVAYEQIGTVKRLKKLQLHRKDLYILILR